MTSRRILIVDKPGGIATHATEAGPAAAEGLCEHLARAAGAPLFVCHRLDKGTTGVIALATEAAAAAELSALFKERGVSKTYLFLTDRAAEADAFTVASRIEKQGSKFVSLPGETNALTAFRRLRTQGRFSLWEASPETGRPHQIRLHAASRGLPILGDAEHGGTDFPALGLHALALRFQLGGETRERVAPAPPYFDDLELLANRRLCSWLAAVDRRERWLRSRAMVGPGNAPGTGIETLRWIHTEGGPLRVERLGDVHDFQWFADDPPRENDWADLRRLAELKGWARWRLHLRRDRGRNPNGQSTWESAPGLPEKWVASENGLMFEFRAGQGLSSGLFLDQRANREWARTVSRGLDVLNLFCYTGGFSVAAAAGGAAKTVSVDLSRNALEWAKTNFTLNGLDPAAHEFRAMDAREFLGYAAKKGLFYDLVVCDPPSFGRGGKGVFRIDKDLPALVRACATVLKPRGRLLLSCNFEGWNENDFAGEIRKAGSGLSFQVPPPPDWDFETPRDPRVMKSALLERS